MPTGDALIVSDLAVQAGAHIYIRMPDIYPDFPYTWISWDDWLSKVDTMVSAKLASSSSAINGWELWNEPDWTWNTAAAGAFDKGWARTFQAVRALDPSTPIVGPSFSTYNDGGMASFLVDARATGTLPDVISWHELSDGESGWAQIDDHVTSYRALEAALGIGPLPISINEYGSPDQVDVPGLVVHYLAQFERSGVLNAGRAYWHESGTVGGLTVEGRTTATYWLYAWYGAMTGDMVAVTADHHLDGAASYDTDSRTVRAVLGGQGGRVAVRITGLDALAGSAHVTLSEARTGDRETPADKPRPSIDHDYAIADGAVTVTFDATATSAYQLVVTPSG